MSSSYLLFGSNMGNRVTNIRQAILSCVEEGMILLQVSHFYETDAWGVENQASFLNVCVQVDTDLLPQDLLQVLKHIEHKIGRQNRGRWQEREIDIDILYYKSEVIDQQDLKIPHPFLIKRAFALHALNELAPEKKHPQLDLTTQELLNLCTDDKAVYRLRYQPKVHQ